MRVKIKKPQGSSLRLNSRPTDLHGVILWLKQSSRERIVTERHKPPSKTVRPLLKNWTAKPTYDSVIVQLQIACTIWESNIHIFHHVYTAPTKHAWSSHSSACAPYQLISSWANFYKPVTFTYISISELFYLWWYLCILFIKITISGSKLLN